jgi:WD40-like Beta Propeller Repeat
LFRSPGMSQLNFQTNRMRDGDRSSRRRSDLRWAQRWCAILLFSCLAISRAECRSNKAPYDAGNVTEPRLFAEGIISTQDDEAGGTFSPDGTEFYFVKLNPYTTFPRLGLICVSRYSAGHWGQPEALPFSGKFMDFAPKVSPDGRTMYFSSSRPAPGTASRVLRVWSVERASSGWGEPHVLPSPVNADDSWNWAPSVTSDGTLYFASNRDGRTSHIYRSRLVNGSYSEVEKLGPQINSEFNESDPYISLDGKILIFSSSATDIVGQADRPETMKGPGVLYARGDLYISTSLDGTWTQAHHLNHNINSVADEGAPSLTPDGKYLFFTSERSPFYSAAPRRLSSDEIESTMHSTLNGHGNIFFVSREALELEQRVRP